MKHSDVSRTLAEHGYMASPGAVEEILGSADPGECLSMLVESLDPADTVVITAEQVRSASESTIDRTGEVESPPANNDAPDALPRAVKPHEVEDLPSYGPLPPFDVVGKLDGGAALLGTYNDFESHFLDRFRRTSRMFRDRVSPLPVDIVSGAGTGKEPVTVVGMVASATETKNGHLLVELEDTSGLLKVLVASDSPLRRDVHLLNDDVIAIRGKMSARGLFIAEAIDFPDVELNGPPNAQPLDACIAFTSDLHVGSREFLADRFEHFIDVLNGRESLPESNGQMERVRYLLVAGDVVDGIGVYPKQYDDLEIDDISEQYRTAAKFFSHVPKNVTVFICPGNHDAVRQAVPQPAIPAEYREGFPENVHFVENPATLMFGGHRVVMSHGRFIEDLTQSLPGTTWTEPHIAMRELLRRRHLMPVYGGRVPIAPETVDRFVLSDVPHIIHAGHTHTFGAGEYRGVKLINAGCWQSQTDFQRRMGIQPEPGKVPIVDLSTGGISVYDFME